MKTGKGKARSVPVFLVWLGLLVGPGPSRAALVFETTSPYHHIRVIDQDGRRTLSFDGSMETRMSLLNPLQGHFEYTEYFHLPWLWNDRLKTVLTIGLGGGSIQRAYQHYYPQVILDAVELDPVVAQVAEKYFHVRPSPTLRVHIGDGRIHLRRTPQIYDAILLDAYTANRYGSFLPYSLATQEFFRLASERLSTNGVLVYNVIGSLQGLRADILGAMYKTLKSVFPQVYLFPAASSKNVVLIATRSALPLTPARLHQRAAELVRQGHSFPPNFRTRINAFRSEPPPAAQTSPILTDDFAPVDGLLRTVR